MQAPGEIEQGMKLKMKTRHPETNRLTLKFRPTIDVLRPHRELTWSTKIVARWLLTVTDTIELKPGAQGGFSALMDGDTLVISGGDAGATPVAALRTALDVAWVATEPVTEVRADSGAAATALQSWW